MNLKQKFSTTLAAGLPLLAFGAFLAIHPMKAKATDDPSCPNGGVYAPWYGDIENEGDCAAGEGGVAYPGMYTGFPVVCPITDDNPTQGGQCDPAGTGCVKCIPDRY